MTTSGVEELSMRLLEAFYDLARGKLQAPVSKEDAVREAGLDAASTEPEVALRYLLNGEYVEAAKESSGESSDQTNEVYGITVPRMDKVRQKREL